MEWFSFCFCFHLCFFLFKLERVQPRLISKIEELPCRNHDSLFYLLEALKDENAFLLINSAEILPQELMKQEYFYLPMTIIYSEDGNQDRILNTIYMHADSKMVVLYDPQLKYKEFLLSISKTPKLTRTNIILLGGEHPHIFNITNTNRLLIKVFYAKIGLYEGCSRIEVYGFHVKSSSLKPLSLKGNFITDKKTAMDYNTQILEGKMLFSAVTPDPPFISYKNINGSYVDEIGIDVNILRELARIFKFRYTFIEDIAGVWGNVLPNGSATGLIGMVARNEVDMSINEITVTESRSQVVSYTHPYLLDFVAILTSRPEASIDMWKIVSPFSRTVWIVLLAIILMIVPSVITIMKKTAKIMVEQREDEKFSFTFLMLEAFRCLMRQDSLVVVNISSARIILMSWKILCFYISVFYSTTLIAHLAIKSKPTTIDNLENLLQACEKGTNLVLARQSYLDSIFKFAKSGIYRDIYKYMNPSEGYILNRDEAYKKILSSDSAYVNDGLSSIFRVADYGEERFHMAKISSVPQPLSILCRTDAVYQDLFDSVIHRLTDHGLIIKWVNDQLHKSNLERAKIRRVNHTAEVDEINSNEIVLTLQNLQAVFLVWFAGLCLSVLAFTYEQVCVK